LAARGYKAVDTDDHELSEWVAVPLDEPTGLGPGRDWVWREDRIQELLSADDVEVLFLSGCSPKPLLRTGAELEVDTSAPLDQVVATVLRLVHSPPASRQPE
jgi:hypothetical protein